MPDTMDEWTDHGALDRGRQSAPKTHPRTFLTCSAWDHARVETYGWTHYWDGLFNHETNEGELILYTIERGERQHAKTLRLAGRLEVIEHAFRVLEPWSAPERGIRP